MATSSSGNLEIYELLKDDFRQVFNKTYFYPEYVGYQNRGARFLKESKRGFISIESTNEYIYVIYSGRSRTDPETDAYSGNNILVYNWNGKPIIRFSLDRDIRKMTLQKQKDGVKIYAYSINQKSKESEIITYTLPAH